MIWIFLVACAASCPIAFSGLWTRRWFRIAWMIFVAFIVIGFLQGGWRPR